MRFLLCRETREPSGFRVAVVGGGPAGLMASGGLACNGHSVVVFEAMPEAGGILIFGIPDGRVNKQSVRAGIRELMSAGVSFVLNTRVGRDVMLEDIVEYFDAVIIAMGAWRSKTLNVPGEDLEWIHKALDWLAGVHLARLGYEPLHRVAKPTGRVLVVGAGYTALDVVTVLRDYRELSGDVESITISYRRSRRDAPMGLSNMNKLEESGVRLLEYTTPTRFMETEGRRVVELARTRVNEKGVIEVTGERFTEEFDTVFLAIGLEPAPLPTSLPLRRSSDGSIIVDDKMMTSIPGVFACGDAVHGPSKIGVAVKSGLEVARNVDAYLSLRMRSS